ncbi:MAG: phosphatidylserine decarboxylase family protein [Desulfobacterales bacterium]|jgi:phosphatidylserine decarboxylase|nr:phosphatidylserine decarboxylase family protein [Desulfobacterales bacterium]
MTNFSWPDPPSQTAYPVARAGFPFILAASFTTAVLALLGLTVPALLGLVVSLFICFFFRDPDRVVPCIENGLVAPADGKVVAVEELASSRFSDGPCRKISIFMSVFNVHVNRIPCDATVQQVRYFPGKFVSANLDKASTDNEHNAVYLITASGKSVCMVQIAGLIARRIICGVQPGQSVQRGQRMGLICFGSRVDVYLPVEAKISIQVGQKVTAGASIIGEWT